nr:8-amino-7-oxononanoate synthase [Candidatus Brocadiales bacterium]
MEYISDELIKIKESGLYRELKVIGNAQDAHVEIEGKTFLSFCSNNYLGIANHPSVIKAVKDAIEEYGWGAGASRLVSGNMTLHETLE